MHIKTTWTNNNPDTIWNKLAVKLGREPTVQEAKAEVQRILNECLIAQASKGKMRHQRGRA